MKNFNTGENPALLPIDIGHRDYCAVLEPDSAFWALVPKSELADKLFNGKLAESLSAKIADYKNEIHKLRFGLKPSAVYFNPTDRCNLNCKYCYIPEKMRKSGRHMSEENLLRALQILKDYFSKNIKGKRKPQIVFHGAEPFANKKTMFKGIEKFGKDFSFGIQTNATLLEDDDISFIKEHGVMIGISMDGPSAKVSDKTRKTWEGKGTFSKVENIVTKFNGYDGLSVICTVTNLNLKYLPDTIEFFHSLGIKTCLLNQIRCTQPASRKIKPNDADMAVKFIEMLDKSHTLFKKTGRKIVVANFANILLAILAPSGRKLMCDISPCGGGRCFFAVSASGDAFPCSEFIGLSEFRGGNIFKHRIDNILLSEPFKKITGRLIEQIPFCANCAIRHFCGAPCPAEAYTMNGGLDKRGAFCEFYEEQTKYAFRLIADNKHNDFLPDNWDKDMTENEILIM
jgi:uncharacterized protein